MSRSNLEKSAIFAENTNPGVNGASVSETEVKIDKELYSVILIS